MYMSFIAAVKGNAKYCKIIIKRNITAMYKYRIVQNGDGGKLW